MDFRANALASMAKRRKAEQQGADNTAAPPSEKPAPPPPVPPRDGSGAGEEREPPPSAAASGGAGGKKAGLLAWAQRSVGSLGEAEVQEPRGFSSGFNDGTAFAAILSEAGLLDWGLVEAPAESADDRLSNLELAFDAAQQHLELPPLLDAQELADSEKYDEKAVMTYVGELQKRLQKRSAAPAPAPAPAAPAPVVSSDDDAIPDFDGLGEIEVTTATDQEVEEATDI